MATYAIGDIQGCFEPLQRLLDQLGFDERRDRLWFVGDLVNRGPDSLATLRFVQALGDTATVVLGNHDLHLLAVAEGLAKLRHDDTLEEVLAAPDREVLLDWLRHLPLMHFEDGYAMVHAGLLPDWSVTRALELAAEAEAALQASNYRSFLAKMYGNRPARWSDELSGSDRLRVVDQCHDPAAGVQRRRRDGVQSQGQTATPAPGLRPLVRDPRPTQPRHTGDLRPLVGAGPGQPAESVRSGYWLSVGTTADGPAAGRSEAVSDLLPGTGRCRARAMRASQPRAISRRVLPEISISPAKISSARMLRWRRIRPSDCTRVRSPS